MPCCDICWKATTQLWPIDGYEYKRLVCWECYRAYNEVLKEVEDDRRTNRIQKTANY